MFVPQSAYDRAITVFSPDGRLFQVEYALETVKRGTLSIGVVASDGVLLAAEEHGEKFEDVNFSRKLFVTDIHLGTAVAGYVPDGRMLVDYAREFCQSHRLIYEEAPSVRVVSRQISDVKQGFTQQAGVRPFGVSMIIGGVDEDNSPEIYVTDPSGSYIKYSIAVIGNRAETARDFIGERYSDEMTLEDLKPLVAAAILRSTLQEEEVKLRFLEVPVEPVQSILSDAEESTAYLAEAKEKYGG